MNNDLLIKCFIAFCIGAIVYKFISDRYLTNVLRRAKFIDAKSIHIPDFILEDIIYIYII